MSEIPKYKCRRCGLPCGMWLFGWKHHSGWHSKPSCGQRPDPVRIVSAAARPERGADLTRLVR
jgi:hypothetical protein